jgi:ligand-binding sensor domain-containing protein/anti-sigma regulatory factor (Ser/Thr protein kinase)
MRGLSGITVSAGALIALLPWCTPALYALDSSRSLSQYLHRIWQAQQGLPSAPIYSISQDREGYIWLGTAQGIVRFDGIRFSQVPALVQHPLADPWVLTLAPDSSGNMWIQTSDLSLSRVSGDDVKTFGVADGLPSAEVSCLARASDGGIWACTATGLAHFKGGKLDFHPAPGGKFQVLPTHACVTPDHVVWASGGEASTLYRWNGSRFDSMSPRLLPGALGTRSMQCAADRIWLGTNDGILELKGHEERRFLERDGLPDNVALGLGETRGDDLWIGTRKGLSRYHNGQFTNYTSREGLSQSTVYAIYQDREGSVWVGTKNGLDQFVDSETTLYTTSDGLPSNEMGPVLEDAGGQIWGGTLGGGLFRFDGNNFSTLRRQDGLASDTVVALALEPQRVPGNSAIWAGTSRGLNRIHNGKVVATYTEKQGLPSRKIRSLQFDRSHVLWVATERGAAHLEGQRFIPVASDRELSRPVAALGEARNGTMLLAMEQGPVYNLQDGRPQKIDAAGNLRDVVTFYTDPAGYVWMGTYGGGLILWKDGQLTRINMRDGLPDGQIFDILADGPDRMWIACSSGYFSVSRSNLLDFAAGKVQKVASTSYNSTLRFRTIESQSDVQPAVWKSHDGKLWFSTIRGLLNFDPKRRGQAARMPQPVIDEVRVNGESVKPDEIDLLAPGQKNITFHYTALSFLHPEEMKFRYKLDGYDADWVDSGNRREAFYTNLPPGQYRFFVDTCESDGNCRDSGTWVHFGLAPQWYQRAWFIPGCVTLLGLLGWGAYRLRIRGLRNQVLIVVGERNRIARELHDTLIQGFSGITMQMQALAGRLRMKEEREVLDEIISDAGKCLQETRRSVAGLRSTASGVSGLASALAEAARHITEQRDVRLRLKLDERPYEMSPEVKYNLLRIAQEAVTNSVKHSGARAIEVELNRNESGVRLSISDDGCGFGRDGKFGIEPLHYGMVGMKERASQIGAEFDVASTPGRGTQIRVNVPLQDKPRVAEIEEPAS